MVVEVLEEPAAYVFGVQEYNPTLQKEAKITS
jgi:hypothetical protein